MTSDQLSNILTEVSSMHDAIRGKIESNPEHVTAEYVCEVLALIDDHGQRVEELLLELEKDLMRLDIVLTQKKDYYETRLEEVKWEDPEIKNLPTGTERTARAKYKLRDLSTEINELQLEIRNTERISKIVAQRNKGLDRSRGSVNKQNEATINSAKYLNLHYRPTTDVFGRAVDEGLEKIDTPGETTFDDGLNLDDIK